MKKPADKNQAPDKWIVAFTVIFGTFMAVMDITVVNVALPHMMGTFSQDLSTITWVATSYSIAQIIMVTMAGWWSAFLGRKRVYMLSLAVFILGSILAGTAQTFTQMLIYRTIQGFGAGALIPVSQAILREAFPIEEQGMAMSIFGMGVVLAPAIGPVLGGYLTDQLGWPWIFYINVPASVPALLLAAAFIHDPPYLKRGVKHIDWFGIILLAMGVTWMQIVLERGQQYNWFASDLIRAGAAVTLVAFITFILWELHVAEPVINIRLLRNVPLAAGSAMGFVFGIALIGTTFILPQFTQRLLGYPAYQSGLVLMPRALSLFMLMPVAGYLLKYIDSRILMLTGIGVMLWAYYGLAQLSLQVGYWNLVPVLLLLGGGMAFMFPTMTSTTLSRIQRKDMTHATSLYTLTRLVGGNVGYAAIATLVANYTQAHRAYLVKNVSALNPLYAAFHKGMSTGFVRYGLEPHAASRAASAAVNFGINQQSTLMAYNDTELILGATLLLIVPLVFLLPGWLKADKKVALE
ncbi:MAG: DHA2 family efflux MFS transporter permease subunit [Sedimentisphaerales bacterium]|jgi:DHA2 family multidrug resistance protein